ncbi:MAG: hypothetical protein LBP64_06495 [Tannerella sp.]|nr:hypothetical protein [Tannerella sp.]
MPSRQNPAAIESSSNDQSGRATLIMKFIVAINPRYVPLKYHRPSVSRINTSVCLMKDEKPNRKRWKIFAAGMASAMPNMIIAQKYKPSVGADGLKISDMYLCAAGKRFPNP